MSNLSSQAGLGRTYLETYYPSQFDEEAFHEALMAVDERFHLALGTLDVEALSVRYGLAHAIIENASILCHLLGVANIVKETLEGQRISVLDVGGGPTIYQHIPISLIADVIVHAEPLEENRSEVLNYLEQASEAYDWNAYFRVTRKFLEAGGFPQLSKELTEIVKALPDEKSFSLETAWRMLVADLIDRRVVPCDTFSSNLELGSGTDVARALAEAGMSDGANLVESNFLLESATGSLEQWKVGLDNLAMRVMPGGFLSMMAIRHAHWYRSGEERVPAVPVDEVFLKQELERRSFSVIQLRVLMGSDWETFGYDGMVFILAQKNMS